MCVGAAYTIHGTGQDKPRTRAVGKSQVKEWETPRRHKCAANKTPSVLLSGHAKERIKLSEVEARLPLQIRT